MENTETAFVFFHKFGRYLLAYTPGYIPCDLKITLFIFDERFGMITGHGNLLVTFSA